VTLTFPRPEEKEGCGKSKGRREGKSEAWRQRAEKKREKGPDNGKLYIGQHAQTGRAKLRVRSRLAQGLRSEKQSGRERVILSLIDGLSHVTVLDSTAYLFGFPGKSCIKNGGGGKDGGEGSRSVVESRANLSAWCA